MILKLRRGFDRFRHAITVAVDSLNIKRPMMAVGQRIYFSAIPPRCFRIVGQFIGCDGSGGGGSA